MTIPGDFLFLTIQAADFTATAGHSGLTCMNALCMKCVILSTHRLLTWYAWPLASMLVVVQEVLMAVLAD